MQINNFVYVMHPENGGIRLSPGEVPEWAEPLITNPSVIVVAGLEIQEPEKAPKPKTGQNPSGFDIPPKGGAGSSAAAWAAYAASQGFEVEDTAKASEIREALEAEGIPTE